MENFEGSRVIWITPFHLSSKRIPIHDLTPYQLPLIKSENENYQIAKQQAALLNSKEGPHTSPRWIIKRMSSQKGLFVYEGDVQPSSQAARVDNDDDEEDEEERSNQDTLVAKWNPAKWELGRQVFHFHLQSASAPSSSHERYPEHTVSMARERKIFTRVESFVVDSNLFIWRWDGALAATKMALFKVTNPSKEIQVARYKGQYPWGDAGGMLTIDESEVNAIVATLTCCAMLRKDLMRRKRTKW